MYLIVRTSDLPSLARPRASRPAIDDARIADAPPFAVRELAGRCGCEAGPDRASPPDHAAVMGEVLSTEGVDLMGGPGPDEIDRRRLARRLDALEAHVDVLARVVERREDHSARAARERAEDRVFDALAALCVAAVERWREERRARRR